MAYAFVHTKTENFGKDWKFVGFLFVVQLFHPSRPFIRHHYLHEYFTLAFFLTFLMIWYTHAIAKT